jgi:hypothetical protein
LNKIPTIAWVCLTVVAVAILGAFVYLNASGVDPAEFYRFLNVILNLASLVLGGGGVVLAGQAREKATQAADQTNGQLDSRIAAGVATALRAQRATDVKPGGVFHDGDQP